jgi:endoglycosylceramidase
MRCRYRSRSTLVASRGSLKRTRGSNMKVRIAGLVRLARAATRPRALVALVVVGSFVLPAGPAHAAVTAAHNGKWLIDAQGRVSVVHGLNVVNKKAPYTPQAMGFGDDDAAFLQANGFNVVRLGVIWAGVEPQPGAYNAAYVAQIKQTQQILASHNIATLLDWHQDLMNEKFGGEGFPAWAVNTNGLVPLSPLKKFPDEYDDPASQAAWDNFLNNVAGPGGVGLQDRLAGAERYVALQFANEPWVLGYDMINEPNKGTNGWPPTRDQKLGSMQARIMRAIRTVDTKHLVFYEPVMTYVIDGESLPAFNDANAGMSYHDYCFEPNGTPQFIYELVCGGILKGGQSNANDHSTRTGNVNLMTEFGSADAWATQLVANDADLNMTSWINWAYTGTNDVTTAIAPAKEGIVLNPAVAPTGTNLYTPQLNVLVRTYPQAVAGTPTSWAYTASSGAFSLTYSTTPPSGTTLAAGATTTIFVPARQYPRGYTVTVSGGSVVAGNGTTSLSIAKNAGATSVTVQITRK